MNAHRMDQETVERLLASSVGSPSASLLGEQRGGGAEPLVRLLAAVRAAARPDELRGEGAALHAYRLARTGSAAPVRATRARPTLLAGLLSAKAALAALAVAATGGVALAATHGALPQPLGRAGERAEAPASGQPAPPSGSPGRTAGSPGGARDPRVPPAPLVVLCHSLRAEATVDRALAEPRYADLVAAAGGPERVPSWCAEAVAPSSTPAATPTPTPTGRPGVDGRPDGRPGRFPATPSLPDGPGSGGPGSPRNPSVPPIPSMPAIPSMPGTPSVPVGRPAPADRSRPATPAAGRPTAAPTGQPVPDTPDAG
ncbi:hypothetical protein [Micromonospora sp. NPDC002575]|uniref:hypothetical protein n=1 Tax=Micromonospora sp. NPDC002575 TaxID=3364222 RepID=UPI00369069C1